MTASQTAKTRVSCAGRLARAAICYALLLAQPDEATTEIRAAPMQWTTEFNTRNAAEVCRLFAPELR